MTDVECSLPIDEPNEDVLQSISFRAAEANDIPSLISFLHPFVEIGRILPRTENEIGDLVPHGFVAIQDDVIIGFAALEIHSIKLAELRSLAVSPLFQGAGIGRNLVQLCVEKARATGIREVMAITSSEDFFKSCGFDFTLPGEKKALFLSNRER